MTNPKVLFLIQLPPPVHGAASINEIFVKSRIIHSAFNVKVLPLHFSKGMHDLGKFSFRKIFKACLYALQLAKILFLFQPHITYFTISPRGFTFYRDFLYVVLLKLSRTKIVYHLHVKGLGNERKLKKMLYSFVFNKTHTVVLSELLAMDVRNVSNTEIHIVNNGIPSVVSASDIGSRLNDMGIVELLYLSNLVRAKGILVFLEAIRLLKEQNCTNFRAVIIGKPADISKEELENFVKANDLQALVTVEGAKYGENKYKALHKADILVHPTLDDAFPIVILEAMQFQLPVISTFEGAIPEIVQEGVTGLLVPKGKPDLLAEKIMELIRNPEYRIKLAVAGRRKFEAQYTSEVMESNLRDVLMNVATSA